MGAVLNWFGRNFWRIIVYGGIFGFLGLCFLKVMVRMPEVNARTRRSHAKSDMRALATAIESYRDRNGSYPPARPLDGEKRIAASAREKSGIEGMTTWDADLGVPPSPDPFSPGRALPYAYFANGGAGWMLLSPGPDGVYNLHPERPGAVAFETDHPGSVDFQYDPTNGTFSAGDVIRTSQDAAAEKRL